MKSRLRWQLGREAEEVGVILKRFMRRLRWLLIYQWRSLSLEYWPYESCWMCGRAFRIRWNVSDNYWCDVVGVLDEGGRSLCVECFLEYAEYLGIAVPDEAIEIEVFQHFSLATASSRRQTTGASDQNII